MENNKSLTGEPSRKGEFIVFTRVFVRLGDGLCAASFVGCYRWFPFRHSATSSLFGSLPQCAFCLKVYFSELLLVSFEFWIVNYQKSTCSNDQ